MSEIRQHANELVVVSEPPRMQVGEHCPWQSESARCLTGNAPLPSAALTSIYLHFILRPPLPSTVLPVTLSLWFLKPKNTGVGSLSHPFSSRSSWPRNQTRVSCIVGMFFTNWAIREAHKTFTSASLTTLKPLTMCAVSRSVMSGSCDPIDCSLPGSSVHGILQARILEWVAISFSRGIFPTQGLNLDLLHCRQTLPTELQAKLFTLNYSAISKPRSWHWCTVCVHFYVILLQMWISVAITALKIQKCFIIIRIFLTLPLYNSKCRLV